jgi:hypothetical protein
MANLPIRKSALRRVEPRRTRLRQAAALQDLGPFSRLYVFSQLLHVECVQLAAAFGSQTSLPIEKHSGSKLHALHMSAQISLSPAKHILPISGEAPQGNCPDIFRLKMPLQRAAIPLCDLFVLTYS